MERLGLGTSQAVGWAGRFTRRRKLVTFEGMSRANADDPVIRAYMRDIDRTLLRENLKLSPAQRLEKFVRFSTFAAELRRAGEAARSKAGRKSSR